MSESSEYHVREAPQASSPRVKPAPKSSVIRTPFSYSPSDDGTDENLLILLHGLGDTHIPFTKLGRSLKLPQTATLAIRAPDKIPFLYEEAYQWYTSFDGIGDLIDNPNPTPALDLLSKILTHLTQDCAWPVNRIHLFGFAQGGSVAAESALKWWRSQPQTAGPIEALGSVVTVGGPLLSYPNTLSRPCPTPLFVFARQPPAESAMPSNSMAAFKKGFANVRDTSMRGEGMPRSRDEWEPIMRFWSENLQRRQVDGLYEVMSGST
ncbi:hypothetical protein PENSPDRAFT_692769 [Peniophora sp. CONT]|nr:hypothetical protein PENSPDRAFT_692769 [Peniophora sp. CONT]